MKAVDVSIGPAVIDEAEQILALQHLCYQSEAALYDDWSIAPLAETLTDLLAAYDRDRILVARCDQEVVGSVRGREVAGTCQIGRLIVHPRWRRRGLGGRLMAVLEACCAEVDRYELFTGHLSEGNLRLYARLGYVEVRREAVSRRLQLVFLEKRRVPN